MPAIRVLIQANHAEPDAVIPALNEHAKRAREEPGCLQFEFFRSGDITENLLQLELWESVAAFDDYWQKHPQSAFMLAPANQLQSPYHYGSPERPRRHGDSGVEFYRHAYSRVSDGVWLPTDESQLPRTIRWPSYTGVRIINQSTEDPTTAGDRTRYINDTRAEPGCTQFEQFRSVEFPVHTVNLELWTTPRIYDYHYLNRIIQQQTGTITRPPQVGPRMERVYGANGFEFYQHAYYGLVDGVWQPENEQERMVTVRWS